MGLFRSTLTFGGLTTVSRVLGFIRDMVFANIFGAGGATDAFFVAFKVPNFFRRLFAEGAFNQAFVPVLSEYKSQRGLDAVRALVGDVTGALGSVLLVLTVLAVVGSPALASLFAPGFIVEDPERFRLTADMLRVTFPYLLFISLTALAGGVLNTYGRFAVPAFTPVWLNVCLIAAALWVSPHFATPIEALAWGVFFAGVVQLGFQLPFLARLGLLTRPRWGWRHEGVRRVVRLMGPGVFGSSVAQINLLLDTVIASFLVSGSVSWLYYSDRLVEFPLGVFGVALGTVILPSLSQRHAESDPEAFGHTLDWALRWMVLIGLPSTLGLMLLAGPILATLFQHGAFEAADVRMARLSLMAYSVGLLGFIGVKVLAPGFYARQDTRTPVRIAVTAMVTNMVLNIAFVVPWAMSGTAGPHAGLALATALGAFTNSGLLFRRLRKDGVLRPGPGWSGFAGRVLAANVAMAVFLFGLAGPLADWLGWGTLERAGRLALLIAGAGAVYFGALRLVGIRLEQWVRLPRAGRT